MLKFKVLLFLLLSSSLLYGKKKPQDTLEGLPFVSAKSWGIIDGKSGEFLWGESEDKKRSAASTAKIMCTYTVLQLATENPTILDEQITYSQAADDTGGTSSKVKAGESLTVKECLYGLMLPSGNDAGIALAEHFNDRLKPEGEKAQAKDSDRKATFKYFIQAMNRHANKLGMSNTTYRWPYSDNYIGRKQKRDRGDERTTTARDLLTLSWHAMKDPLFRKIVGTQKYTVTLMNEAGDTRELTWKNSNKLLQYEGYTGIKTGITGRAGGCLASSNKRGDDYLMMAVLGSDGKRSRFTDTQNLYRWAWLQRKQQ